MMSHRLFIIKHCQTIYYSCFILSYKMCIRDRGRFVVSLPFESDNPQLGESYATAEARFLSLERRLKRDSELAREYANFIQEYRDLGHMALVDDCSVNSRVSNTYYLPHHAVFKHSSSTTNFASFLMARPKLPMVFLSMIFCW